MASPFPYSIDDLLRLVVEKQASDLHLSVGSPPVLRVNGDLARLDMPILTAMDTDSFGQELTNDFQFNQVREHGTVDFAITHDGNHRFRVSVFRQKTVMGLAIRLLPDKPLSLEEIGVPASVKSLLDLPRGLVLVTGPTGSGKTTTLASMLDVINRTRACHILTIEDPIEYVHSHQRALVNQREIGIDVPNFAEALRRALRQDPDVILVGEMRDLETIEAAITAAETGHLVFSTAHTTGAARTVDRLIDVFPPGQQEQTRVQLSTNLRAVISQLLLPRKDGQGRIAAFEVMINTPATSTFIREGKTFRITNDIQTGAKFGMVSLDASLVQLYLDGIISESEMRGKAQDPDGLQQLLPPLRAAH
ncbi:MAG TPA: type IV pilus twitching motility protein PilT [Chthoniobacterales bacterium]